MLVSIDFETHLISQEHPVPKPVCLSYCTEDSKTGLLVGEEMEEYLKKLLRGPNEIIAHNMRFEAAVIDTYMPELRKYLYQKFDKGELICTKIIEQLVNCASKKPMFMYSLDALVLKYFDKDISADKKDPDSWRMRYSELEGVPIHEWPVKARDYAIDDSIWALKCFKKQKKVDYALSVSADFYLNKMGIDGILLDMKRVHELKDDLEAKLKPHYEEMMKMGYVRQEKGKYKKNMKKLREYIEENVPDPKLTPKGHTSTTSEALMRLTHLKPVRLHLDIMKYEKALTAFVVRLEKAPIATPRGLGDRPATGSYGLIRSTYKAVVSSGRTSSSTDSNFASVNIQQMPRELPGAKWDIRNCFTARPGYKICSIDYAGLELTSTAHQLHTLTGRSDMRAILNSGDKPVDMHSMLAYRIMNLKEGTSETYESFVKQKKDPKYKHYRQLSKPINLGFPGGIGYDTMRTLLAKDGIVPRLEVLDEAPRERNLARKRATTRLSGYPTRIRRVASDRYQLVYDELLLLKQQLFDLYPDLEYFLKNGHEEYLSGEHKFMKNEFGEWEKEPMYKFEVGEFKRDFCMYTQVCNGLLMQSPSAIGAKKAVTGIMARYQDSDVARPLAFIHDEILLEVKEDAKMHQLIQDVSEEMIDQMQKVLPSVRVCVEADISGQHWSKAESEWSRIFWKDYDNQTLKQG